MRKKLILKGIFINFFATFLPGIVLFFINKLFLNNLGIQYLGLMNLFTQFLLYLSLADMGLSEASSYALYKPLANKNFEKIDIIISTIDYLYKIISLAILILGLLVSVLLPFFIKNFKISIEVYVYWILYVINTSITYLFAKYNILMIADQKITDTKIIQFFSKIMTQILQIFFLIYFKSFYLFILSLIFGDILQYIIYRLYFSKEYGYI